MIKKIICPTDFSVTANNAIEYAAKISQILNAELQIINIQSLSPVDMITSGVRIGENIMSASDTLKEMCAEVNKTFTISCSYDIETTNEKFEKSISRKFGENNLIVMGTNGVDDMYQYFYGTNTYHVIKKSKCPVLMVPDNVSYGTIKKIVFALDYKPKNKLIFSQLNDITDIFNPEFIFLHISMHKTQISSDVFRAFKDEILSYLKNKSGVEFEQIYSDNVAESIDNYMNKSNANLLAITFHDKGLIGDIFHQSVAKELSEIAGYPMLVLHE